MPWSPLLPTASYRGHVWAAMAYVQIPTDLWAEDAGQTSSPAPSCSVQEAHLFSAEPHSLNFRLCLSLAHSWLAPALSTCSGTTSVLLLLPVR